MHSITHLSFFAWFSRGTRFIYDLGELQHHRLPKCCPLALIIAWCAAFPFQVVDFPSPEHHDSKSGKWEVGTEELRLFVKAAERMTPVQRRAFTQALAPGKVRGRQ